MHDMHYQLSVTQQDFDTIKWHHHLGHLNLSSLNTMKTRELVTRLPKLKTSIPLCVVCVFGKHHQISYPQESATWAIKLLALIHTDVCGPMQTTSLGRALYFLIFVDDYSRYTHVYFLKSKSDTFTYFQ